MPPRWIDRAQAGVVRPATSGRVTLDDVMADLRDRELLATVRSPSRPRLPKPPPPETISQALARLAAHATPQLWTCSIRDELVRDGYVEITVGEDGRWTGDQITEAGRLRLRSR